MMHIAPRVHARRELSRWAMHAMRTGLFGNRSFVKSTRFPCQYGKENPVETTWCEQVCAPAPRPIGDTLRAVERPGATRRPSRLDKSPAPQHPQGVPRSAAPARRVHRTGATSGPMYCMVVGSWVGGLARRSCADLAAFARTASGPGLTCGPGRFSAGSTWPDRRQAARRERSPQGGGTVRSARRRTHGRQGRLWPDTGEGGDRVRFG